MPPHQAIAPTPSIDEPHTTHGPRQYPSSAFQDEETLPLTPKAKKQRHGRVPMPAPGPHDQGRRFPSEGLSGTGPKLQDQGKYGKPHDPNVQPFPADRARHTPSPHGLKVPSPRRTKPHTWVAAVFCAVFWLIIILGGLAVLIVYLVFRPSDPKFDISSATFNAGYLDMGYLLNSDVTILVNFTNPNKKVTVDFTHLIMGFYYDKTLIATTYVNPFKAASRESKFADVRMVTSQVRLPEDEIRELKKQAEKNRIMFELRGWFRARSHLGSYLPYSYTLYSHCTIVMTSPPAGVMVAKRCITKR